MVEISFKKIPKTHRNDLPELRVYFEGSVGLYNNFTLLSISRVFGIIYLYIITPPFYAIYKCRYVYPTVTVTHVQLSP